MRLIHVAATALLTAALVLTAAPAQASVTTQIDLDAPQLSTTTATDRVLTAYLSPALGQQLELQRKDRSGWGTVRTTRAPDDGAGSFDSARLAIPAKAGSASYRVVVRAVTGARAATSATFSLHQTDMAADGTYVRKIRKIIATYCPNTPIYIDTPDLVSRQSRGVVGLGGGGLTAVSSRGRTTHTLRGQIQLVSGLTGTTLRHVALHECAHVVQWRENITGRYDAETRAANKLFPAGIEGQADCMAYSLVRSTRDLYYLDSCSRDQLSSAKRIWREYGGYRADPYVWTTRG